MNDVEILLNNILKDSWISYDSLYGGMMNRSYLVKAKDNKNYILYIPGNDSVSVNREIERFCQNELSSIGISGKNIYFDENKGIKMNEFIPGSSLDKINDFDYQKVADLLKKMHSYPKKTGIDYAPFKRFLNEYEPNALLTKHKLDDAYFSLKEVLLANKDYLENIPTVLSHNDFQRSNIIKGDDNNYYVIDFEFAMDNDEIYDIAAFGNGLVKEGRTLLDYYFKDELNEDKIKRYYLWRIYLSLQWYLVAINKHYQGEGAIHGIDFLSVSIHFLNNAKEAKAQLDKELK